LGNPSTAPNPILGSRNATTGAIATAYTGGFGTFGNLNNANAFGGSQRSGMFIARFTF
jgi:hypothetical protein